MPRFTLSCFTTATALRRRAGVREALRPATRARLLWLEAGSTALRAGRAAAALAALDEGLAMLASDPRARGFGEDARWHYLRGAALLGLRQADAAERDLHRALTFAAPRWVRGRTHLELGKLADLRHQRERALDHYRIAGSECSAARDPECAERQEP